VVGGCIGGVGYRWVSSPEAEICPGHEGDANRGAPGSPKRGRDQNLLQEH